MNEEGDFDDLASAPEALENQRMPKEPERTEEGHRQLRQDGY